MGERLCFGRMSGAKRVIIFPCLFALEMDENRKQDLFEAGCLKLENRSTGKTFGWWSRKYNLKVSTPSKGRNKKKKTPEKKTPPEKKTKTPLVVVRAKDLEELKAQNLSLKKKNEELNVKVLSLEKDKEFYREMILTANKKLERLEKQDWGRVQRLIYDFEKSKQGEEQDKESLRLESKEKRKRDLEREAARALQKSLAIYRAQMKLLGLLPAPHQFDLGP
ncbi:hypothetical protein Tco_0895044 [Tanacetum coccineum]|uniref:Uncharacterized protein n=1 Tax=Tanacetum coccineum TaxID=301880 RepID=A0ABQ5CFU2_9ASTR